MFILTPQILTLLVSAPAQKPQTDAPKPLYAVVYTPGPKWKKGLPLRKQDLSGHIGYMEIQLKAKKLVLGGPFLDSTGGESVFEFSSMEEAKDVVFKDPSVKAGVLKPTIHPWLTLFRRD